MQRQAPRYPRRDIATAMSRPVVAGCGPHLAADIARPAQGRTEPRRPGLPGLAEALAGRE